MRNFMEVTRLIGEGYSNADEISRYLGVKRSTIYQWAKEGKIPAYKPSRMWRFKEEEIDAWMGTHREDGSVADKKARRVFENVKGLTRRPKGVTNLSQMAEMNISST